MGRRPGGLGGRQVHCCCHRPLYTKFSGPRLPFVFFFFLPLFSVLLFPRRCIYRPLPSSYHRQHTDLRVTWYFVEPVILHCCLHLIRMYNIFFNLLSHEILKAKVCMYYMYTSFLMEIEGPRLANFDNSTIIRTLHDSRGLVLYKHTLTGDKHVFTHKCVTLVLTS